MHKLVIYIGMSFFVLIILIFLNSCATLFGHNDRKIQVTSNDKNALVYVNGVEYGKVPIAVEGRNPTFSTTYITVKDNGYISQTKEVPTSFQPLSLLDILCLPAFEVCGIVDIVTGNIMKYDTKEMNFYLDKK